MQGVCTWGVYRECAGSMYRGCVQGVCSVYSPYTVCIMSVMHPSVSDASICQ